ncbi:MAG: GNAT family N-acetyltransferase, partial [Gemmatimonadales bacterium]
FVLPGEQAPLAPGATLLVITEGGRPLAGVSVQLAEDLEGAPGRSGMVGHLRIAEAAGTAGPGTDGHRAGDPVTGDPHAHGTNAAHAATTLLRHACSHLAKNGARRVLGPMNGSTWAPYRLVTDPAPGGAAEPQPPFLMEPRNPPHWPELFREAGFQVRSEYVSARVTDLARAHPRRAESLAALEAQGVELAPIRMDRFEEELADIHRLSLEAFAGNPLYSPLPWEAFRAMYTGVRPLLNPELVQLARTKGGTLAGFFFALPDTTDPGRLILKTVAVANAHRGTGLGVLLLDEPRRLAREHGHLELIHALMHVDNPSARISRHSGEVFRRYALFQWIP